MGEIIGVIKPQESKRCYGMTIGINEYLCQIVNEDEFLTFTIRGGIEVIDEVKDKKWITIKNVFWLVPGDKGDIPVDYEMHITTGAKEVKVNVANINKFNLLRGKVAEQMLANKNVASAGILTNPSKVDLSSRAKGVPDVR